MADNGNGRKLETLRWLAGLILAGLVAYFTAIGALDKEIAVVKAVEESHFAEVQRALEDIKQELVRLRRARERE